MPPTTLQTISITGPLRSGGSIWLDPLKEEAIRRNTCWSWSINSPAKPVKTAESGPVIDFISEVVHRYGVHHNIIIDNGSNFTADEVKIWCSKMGIKLDYASVYHPQTNDQAERANGLIMSGIKPRLVRSLKESDTHWVEELDSVLWGLRTMPNRITGYTPFLWCTA